MGRHGGRSCQLVATDAVLLGGTGPAKIVAVAVFAESQAVDSAHDGLGAATMVFWQFKINRVPLGSDGMAAKSVSVTAEAADLADAARQILAMTFITLARR